jgi:hypothetical protein
MCLTSFGWGQGRDRSMERITHDGIFLCELPHTVCGRSRRIRRLALHSAAARIRAAFAPHLASERLDNVLPASVVPCRFPLWASLEYCSLSDECAPQKSVVGPPLPTCAAHQSRRLSEVLQTCRSNGYLRAGPAPKLTSIISVDFPPERDCLIGFLAGSLRICLVLLAPAVLVNAQQPREFTEKIRPQIWSILNDV